MKAASARILAGIGTIILLSVVSTGAVAQSETDSKTAGDEISSLHDCIEATIADGESSVDFVVCPWLRTDDYWNVYWDVTREVKLRFDAEGISIPFPQRDVHVYGTDTGAIPSILSEKV